MSYQKRGKPLATVMKYCPSCGEEMVRFKNLSYDCPECQKKKLDIKSPWVYVCPVCKYIEGAEE